MYKTRKHILRKMRKHKTRKHTMRKMRKHTMHKHTMRKHKTRKTHKMYGGTVEELNRLLKEFVVDDKLHIPPLSEEQRTEFKNVKLPDTLTELNCIHRGLKELPKLPPNLKVLYCQRNILVKLPKLPDTLEVLECYSNMYMSSTSNVVTHINTLKKLPELPPNLKILKCYANSIEHIPDLPPNLEELYCSGNKYTTLPTLPKSLKTFVCHNRTLNEPYASFVRMDEMKDRINSVRLDQLAIIGSKLDNLHSFQSINNDLKTSIGIIISGNSKSLPKIREDINRELSDLVDKLGDNVYKILEIGEKTKHNEEMRKIEEITNNDYNANINNNNNNNKNLK